MPAPAGPRGESRPPRSAATVVRIIARLNVGGPAIHVVNLCAGMAGRYSTLLLAGTVDASEADMGYQAVAQGVNVLTLPEMGRRVSLWKDFITLVKMYRVLRRVRPTIVHTHTAKAGTLGRIAAFLAGVPIRVHTFHGHVMRGYFSPAVTRLVVWAERVLARLTTCIVTVSPRQAAELVDEFRICPAEKMRVVSLGFDLTQFDPQRLAAVRGEFRQEIGAGDDPIIATIGRLVPIKSHDLLLRAAAELHRRGQRFVLAIVGGGPEDDRLRALSRELGLDGRIRFLGWRRDFQRIYADTDVVALTSLNEGTPVCLIEALASGCAVVATRVGGVPDVLEDGLLGAMVAPGDASAFADSLQALLRDPARREELRRLGPRSVRARFALGRLLHDVSDLYDELLAAHGLRVSSPTS